MSRSVTLKYFENFSRSARKSENLLQRLIMMIGELGWENNRMFVMMTVSFWQLGQL